MTPQRPTSHVSDRFRRTRADHRDETAEDYVEAVAHLIDQRGEARVRDLSEMMGVSHVTVSRIVARLCEEGYLSTEPYQPIRLTDDGRALAKEAERRHRVVLSFLRAIGVSTKQAEIDAEGIEHHVSEETIRAMERLLEERGVDQSP